MILYHKIPQYHHVHTIPYPNNDGMCNDVNAAPISMHDHLNVLSSTQMVGIIRRVSYLMKRCRGKTALDVMATLPHTQSENLIE